MNINDVLTDVKIPEDKAPKPKKSTKSKKVVESVSAAPAVSKNESHSHVYGLGKGYDRVLERINRTQPNVYNNIINLD